jgi:hypothetical protein
VVAATAVNGSAFARIQKRTARTGDGAVCRWSVARKDEKGQTDDMVGN